MHDEQWQAEHRKLKTMWVVSIMMFWFTLTFQGVIYLLDGTVNLILMSIILGMLVIGTALKFKLQKHERKRGKGGAT